MIKNTFRINGYMPDHIFFDNNCQLAKLVKAGNGKPGDPAFDKTGLSVDVFHFNCKHSEKDTYCQLHCNPISFPELLGEGGKGWFFNSSIAEQTNVWLGGYHSICREMLVDKYRFFLDEMILIRNQFTYAKLERDRRNPSRWPSLATV